MSKSNSDITSQKLMKQRLNALIKAGDEMRYSLEYAIGAFDKVSAVSVRNEIAAWDAAKKTP